MKKAIIIGVLALFPFFSFAAPLTQEQANSLIKVVQSFPGTPASVFTNLITVFSNITVKQAESLIVVVQSAPSTPANAFVGMLIAFTEDQPATSTTTQSTIEVSSFANEFKFSSHIFPIPIISLQNPEKVVISATGYRNNYAVRGWFKWWTVNRNSDFILVEETLNSVFYPAKQDESLVPIEFTGEIPLDKLSPNGSKGYTKHYFQFYFERGSSQSHSEPIEFAEGY